MGYKLWTLSTIHNRILIPFLIIFLALTLLISIITLTTMSSTIDKRIQGRMEHILSALPQSGFVLNSQFLQRLKGVVEADISIFNIEGDLKVTTINEDRQEGLLALIDPKPFVNRLHSNKGKSVFADKVNEGGTYRVVYSLYTEPQSAQPVILSLMISTRDISAAKKRSAFIIGGFGLVGIIVMFFLGHIVAKGITTPLKGLVVTMEEVAEGDLSRKAQVGPGDEVGRLSQSFNSMIERLRESEEKLIQGEKLSVTGKLAAGIAHDLRNPLSSIKMLVQILAAKLKSDKSDEKSLEILLSELEKVESVVRELLDLSKPEEVRLANDNILNAINNAVRLTDGQFRHMKIILREELDPSLPDIPMDRDRLKQAFLNLLLNSAEAMPKGGEINLRAYVENKSLNVEIQDSGSGIPESLGEKIFEPFFTTKKEGIGLGLSNTKRIIKQHGGGIYLKNHKSGGTICKITIPIYNS